MQPNLTIDVSVIIVNFNTCQLTSDCIKSVLEKTKDINIEIIVVDNASSDGSVPTIKKMFPGVTVIESHENIGFGKANNLGATSAKGTYLFLLNSDTLLLNNAIGYLAKCMQQDKDNRIGICGGNLFTKELQPNHSYASYYPTLLNIFLYRSRLLKAFNKTDTFNLLDESKEVSIIIGADLFIRKKLFDELGGFDPYFFMYVEDGELNFRVRKAGFKIVSVPAAKIIHYQGKSSTTANKLIMEVSSYIYYFRKHHNQATVAVYKLVELFFAVFKFTFFIFNRGKRAAYGSLIRFLVK
ncbi:MAG: glycosyltransferase family 2 protein [Chitinophagaceae bacterium]|nr:glycosyltransferase family 2 protein [Chitinophagaceae bacterium]